MVFLFFCIVFGVTVGQHRFKWLPFSMVMWKYEWVYFNREVFKISIIICLCFASLNILHLEFFFLVKKILQTMSNAWDTSCLREIVIFFTLIEESLTYNIIWVSGVQDSDLIFLYIMHHMKLSVYYWLYFLCCVVHSFDLLLYNSSCVIFKS